MDKLNLNLAVLRIFKCPIKFDEVSTEAVSPERHRRSRVPRLRSPNSIFKRARVIGIDEKNFEDWSRDQCGTSPFREKY